ncbi:hypothetical protein KBAHV27_04720 [Aeromonas hydrophila]|nr:hypothetical protein KBAHV27_04720 [Aeromonas hydrophila]
MALEKLGITGQVLQHCGFIHQWFLPFEFAHNLVGPSEKGAQGPDISAWLSGGLPARAYNSI